MAFDREKTLASAQKHIRKGHVDRAIKEYERLLDSDPKDLRSKLKLADLLVKVDRFDDALGAYREVANSYGREDLYEKAAAVFKQALRIAPDDPVLHTDLGDCYYRLGRLKDAVRVFHKAQKIYKRENNILAQREILERMVRIDPEDVGLRIQLAERYEKDNDRQAAADLFRGAAQQLQNEGRLDEYVQVLERMIYLEPDRLDMRKEVVRIYLGRGDEKHALKHLQFCFKATPQDIDTLELLASTFHRLGSTDKALLVYLELAAMYERLGETDRAAGAYRTILTIDQRNARAQRFLGQDRQPTRRVAAAPPAPVEPEPEDDALDGIEFLDEDDSEFEEIVVVNQQPSAPARAHSEPATAVVEISEASLELVEVDAAPTGPNQQVHQFLSESEVFLKYGLLDRAEEVITKVLRMEPNNLQGREQMSKLLDRMGDKRGAAHQLVEMARICSRQPVKAREFLSAARSFVDDETLRNLAQGARLDPSLYESDLAPEFITEVSEGLDEASALTSDDLDLDLGIEDLGDFELDLDADFEDLESIAQTSAAEDIDQVDAISASDFLDDFSMDDFVDMGGGVEDIGDDFALGDADLVDVDVNVDFDENELQLLDGPRDFGGHEFDISAEDADAMFDELFGGGMFGDSEPVEEIAGLGMDSGAFEEPADEPVNHFGSRSLSQKFRGPVTDPTLKVPEFDADTVNNSSLELGKTYKDMGLFAEALDEFRAALEDPDAAPAALYNMALCHIELGEADVAHDRLKMLTQDRSFPQHWRTMAQEKLLEIRV